MLMNRPSRFAIPAIVLAAALASPAVAGAQLVTPKPDTVTHVLSATDEARADSIRHPYTADDIRFMTEMIGHHAQAIVMSRMAPTHGASPSVQILAARIINAQQDEIKTMQQWLRARHQPVPDPAKPMMMTMDGMEMPMLMPGMLTDEQMKTLDAARGIDFDRLFLTGMIQHHSGAITMVSKLFSSYGAGQDELVFKFATDVNTDQTTEIARMQKMLAVVIFGTPETP
jgi:uncharacterized protein (DUF305 family)